MARDPEANAAERRRWNDEYWAGVWPRREQLTGAVTGLLLDSAGLSVGQRVLDIGSGAGITSIEAGRRVGPTGLVIGADVSAPLVDFAARRTTAAQLDNVEFVVVDMQLDALDDAPFDAAISQFGVMFFDAPIAAFTNIRRQLAPGGQLSFACWQPLARNDWHLNHAVGEFLPPASAAGPFPGPFSLGDPSSTNHVLSEAGWRSIEQRALELEVTVDRDAIVDDDQLPFLGIVEAQLESAMRAVNEHLSRFRRVDGRYDLTLAVQLVSCVA